VFEKVGDEWVVCLEKVGDELVVFVFEVFFMNCAIWNVSS
jgi:hypothetical protein